MKMFVGLRMRKAQLFLHEAVVQSAKVGSLGKSIGGAKRLGCSCWDRLKVWRFSPHVAEVNILYAGELVLVENILFGCGTVEPCWALRFDKNAAGKVDVNLGINVCWLIEVMVGNPGPDIFDNLGVRCSRIEAVLNLG